MICLSIEQILASEIFTLVVIPILIFIARIADVSLGTLRIIFISKGFKFLAPLLGFFEVAIWLIAARQVLNNLTTWIPIVAYSAGFAAGTYAGMIIEQKVSLGKVLLRVITNKDAKRLLSDFEKEDFPITSTHAVSSNGNVHVLFLVISRKRIDDALNIIKKHNPHASYSVEDVRFATENHITPYKKRILNFGMFRKSK